MAYRLILSALIAIGMGYLLLAGAIPLDPWSESEAFNSKTLPYAYGVLLCASAALLFARRVSSAEKPSQLSRLILLVGIVVVFVAVLQYTGLWFGLAMLIAACIVALGERRIWTIALPAIALPLVGWLVVEVGLKTVIPL